MRYSWVFQFGFLITFLIVSMGCGPAKSVIRAVDNEVQDLFRVWNDAPRNPPILENPPPRNPPILENPPPRNLPIPENHVSDDVVKRAADGDDGAINKIIKKCYEDAGVSLIPRSLTPKDAIMDAAEAMLEKSLNSQIFWNCGHIREIVEIVMNQSKNSLPENP
jgi:hypothetical protein